MQDVYSRTIDYMRISITDRCNLRCRYCMPGEVRHLPEPDMLTYEEMLTACRAGAKAGIRHIRVTGGEPLVREGAAAFIAELKRLPGVEHVMMTTNGVLLGRSLEELAAAGIDGINISLDSMSPQSFARITGFDCLDRVMGAMDQALDLGIPIKVNCVPIRGFNDGELEDFVGLARERPVDVRFIELMPTGYGKRFEPAGEEWSPERVAGRFGLTPSAGQRGFGPASYYQAEGMKGSIGFIRALHEPFCGTCNRIRLTASGFLRLCLFDGEGVDLRACIRAGMDVDELAAQFGAAIGHKPGRHHLLEGASRGMISGLSEIGG